MIKLNMALSLLILASRFQQTHCSEITTGAARFAATNDSDEPAAASRSMSSLVFRCPSPYSEIKVIAGDPIFHGDYGINIYPRFSRSFNRPSNKEHDYVLAKAYKASLEKLKEKIFDTYSREEDKLVEVLSLHKELIESIGVIRSNIAKSDNTNSNGVSAASHSTRSNDACHASVDCGSASSK